MQPKVRFRSLLGPIAALSILGLGVLLAAPAQSISTDSRYYQSTLQSKGWTWKIGLQIDRNGDEVSGLTVDLPSLWRVDLGVEPFRQAGETLSFTLPEDLGQATLSGGTGGLTGTVEMDDGHVGSLSLTPSQKPRIVEKEVRLTSQSDGTRIAASTFLPAGDGPYPAAVMIHGGGNSSREVAGYRFWGVWLARNGIAALLYDKRGNGQSGGDWRTVDFEARAGDVQAGVNHLRTLSGVDKLSVGLVAVSQGSWIANIVAARDDRLGFVVHVSGPAVPVKEADGFAIENRLQSQGASEEAIRGYLGLWVQHVDALVHPDDGERMERLHYSLEEASRQDWFKAFPYSLGNPKGWWSTWYGLVGDFDPAPYLKNTRVPMLWIYGDVDTQSDVARNVALLQKMRSDQGLPALAVFPQSGHGLMAPADRFGRPLGKMTVAPGFFQTVFQWIHRRAR